MISPSTDRVLKTFPVGSEPSGITAGDGSIWVANEGDGTVFRSIHPISNELGWDFVARRVGNYQNNPQLGMLVDQLWVR